jgi:predicted O-methyltransferase YrrM
MKSSYIKKDITYGEFIQGITQTLQPSNILEIGILDGYSLESFVKASNQNTKINAFDLFDDFNGNHSDKTKLLEYFKEYTNVTINHGDFFKLHNTIPDSEYDLIHIDIANNGDVFEYVIENYLSKLSNNGVLLFEGGSIDRDNVEWMKKYNKTPIYPMIKKYKEKGFNIKTYGDFPSISLIRK